MTIIESEFRSYPYIEERLREMGWDTKSPSRGGRVYTQNEATKQNAILKKALVAQKPEYVVVVRENDFWVIEAKADRKDLDVALNQAKERAKQINAISGIQCRLVTGVAGNPDSTHYIETQCLVSNRWKHLLINNRQSTGFISPSQAIQVLNSKKGRLLDYDIDDILFREKTKQINELLHNGAFHKRNRAGALACLLLALANDQQMPLNSTPTNLINDINSRARGELTKYGKEAFYKEISIHKPTSPDNHTKNRIALAQSIGILRDLNIASTINSGRDVLGECYEEFLTYASDAKELGIVLTPRHITNFGAQILDIQKNDIVFDPTCGTGGFLVAALDKVRRDGGDMDKFKKGNLHGVEQDALIATLAIVNMVFRGDGSSNIKEGNCLKTKIEKNPSKVLMNPPFALKNEKEWEFVDKALEQMTDNGLLFAVLPTGTMSSSKNGRGEIAWRKNMLKRHTLISVIKLENELFYPLVSQGTCAVVIKAHRPHKPEQDKVVWAVLEDGIAKTKTQREKPNNIDMVAKAVRNYIATQTEPDYMPEVIDCSLIESNENDLSPEKHIGINRTKGFFDVKRILNSIETGKQFLVNKRDRSIHNISHCHVFLVSHFCQTFTKGRSGLKKEMGEGDMPLISASEINNGIAAMVRRSDCRKVYPAGWVTISDFGIACYHNYEFAATSHVIVGELKPEYKNEEFAIFLCASITSENWRFSFNRPLTMEKIQRMKVRIPVNNSGEIDMDRIKKMFPSG